ncbi:MAG: glycosyltransferase [Alphaproteobacteria bacterium]|nr:glycosyltransferase [Alphaproteobacteria bacterium]
MSHNDLDVLVPLPSREPIGERPIYAPSSAPHFDNKPEPYTPPPYAPQLPNTQSAAQGARIDLSLMVAGALIVICVAAVIARGGNVGVLLPFFLPLQCLTALPIIWGACFMHHTTEPSSTILLADKDLPIYSVLIPLYKEANMVPQIYEMLKTLDYPPHKLDVLILLEDDDRETQNAAAALDWSYFCRVLIVPKSAPRTKPHACNYGLGFAKGQLLVIYDAEDRPDSQQLRAAASAFHRQPLPLACLQSPLHIISQDKKWLQRQFAFEYRVLFLFVLPLLTKARLAIPLGGTSNHFRIAVLRALNGWDAYNLTEDADLGYRLVAGGYTTQILPYATTENAPTNFKDWFRQRTRWLSGHIQTWHVHMRHPSANTQQMGGLNMAAMNIVLATRLMVGPVHCAFLFLLAYDYMKNGGFGFTLSFALFFTCIFYASLVVAALFLMRGHNIMMRLFLVATLPLYWILLTPPTLYACWRMLRRDYRWLKSNHQPY